MRSRTSNASRLARTSRSPVPTTARRRSDETTWSGWNHCAAQCDLPAAVAPTRTTRHGSGRRSGGPSSIGGVTLSLPRVVSARRKRQLHANQNGGRSGTLHVPLALTGDHVVRANAFWGPDGIVDRDARPASAPALAYKELSCPPPPPPPPPTPIVPIAPVVTPAPRLRWSSLTFGARVATATAAAPCCAERRAPGRPSGAPTADRSSASRRAASAARCGPSRRSPGARSSAAV